MGERIKTVEKRVRKEEKKKDTDLLDDANFLREDTLVFSSKKKKIKKGRVTIW